jgi:hypothetical protein
MKKVVIMLVLTLTVGAAYSQAQFAVGLKGGLNYAKLDGQDVKSNRTGFHAGAFTLIKFTKIGIQPEIIFSQQGSKFRDIDKDGSFDYVNIPVMLKLYTVAGINLQVGPQFGFLTKAEIEGQGSVKEKFKNSDVSLGLGLGWDLPFGLTVDARYNLGLSDIDDDPAYSTIKNQVVQVSVGYKFIKLGK